MTHAIRVLKETADTVTIDRADFEALLQAAEDAEDLVALAEHDAEEARIGRERARRDYLTGEEATRLLEGDSPIRVWREKRGLTQRALAAAAGMQPGYLADIERGRKAGSIDALNRLSAVLGVGVEDLMKQDMRRRQRHHGPVLVITTGRLAGSATGGNWGSSDQAEYATIAEALAALRSQWLTLQSQLPTIFDKATNEPIFGHKELSDMMVDGYGRQRAHDDKH
jgi:ribosome-binding protein aMBF1 (putative translation factor)